jgi:hypothetical protein
MADSYKLNIRAVSRLNELLNTTMDLTVHVDSTIDSLSSGLIVVEKDTQAIQKRFVFFLFNHVIWHFIEEEMIWLPNGKW